MTKRLLLVDDVPRGLDETATALRALGEGFATVRVLGASAAIDEFTQNAPDLVVLHASAPGEEGLALLAHIRARAGGDAVPVVLITKGLKGADRQRAFDAGIDDVLAPPMDSLLLVARVRALLRLAASRQALRHANSELARRNEALERLQQDQRDFIAFIVHDLKTPLAVAWSNVDFAREQLMEASPSLRDALEEASHASRRLRAMIDDLITMSRLEQADFPVHLEPTPVAPLLYEVVREYVQIAGDKQVQLLPPEDVPRVQVRADPPLLQRVLENILDNSLRHTPARGRVAVAASVGTDVKIAVSNSGPSIPASERARIFEKFARLDPRGVMRGNAGLGLYFCKRAIEALGGAIEVTQTPEWPTSFELHLPVA